MSKTVPVLFLLAFASAGCAEKPEPQPDPQKLREFVASLDTPAKEPGKTERLIASVEKIPPERIDPKAALAVVRD